MQFGVCVGRSKAASVAAGGWDYIELGVAGELIPESEDTTAWAEKKATLLALPLPCKTFNLFVPGKLKITGPEVNQLALTHYAHRALSRAAEVGGEVIVFGSGGARQLPQSGWSAEQAHAQLVWFLNQCADAHEQTGVVVAIEPLNRHECNLLHTVAEGAALAREVGRPGVRNLADTYHMERNGDESLADILASADCLAHVHTADTGRKAPGTGVYDHAALFTALQEAGYDARVSIECNFTDGDFETELALALAHLKRAYRSAQSAG
ncbi:sugar phosphate isomerase/epimerase family protein [Armatimonas sp.]|uniref:sugar phosphate isomerase/epimerase family protein n=1 Tax=Armatimonas sp. TaxID=1872638 RepID=UPI00375020B4